MNKIILLLLSLTLTSIGCSYENKERYELAVNEEAEIYYSTNSCCFYCIANKSQLKHVKFIERKMVDSGTSGCAGCDHTSAFVFEATSVGVDTIKLIELTAGGDCDSVTDVGSEKYIIEVK